MPEELQSLLEKIQEDGVKKADLEKEKILSDAKAEAEKIIADAENKSKEIIKKSEEKAKNDLERAENSIRQAARDIALALNSELQERLTAVAKECVGNTMTPEFMGEVILKMQESYLAKSTGEPDIEVLLTKNDLEKVEKLMKGAMFDSLKKRPEFSMGHDFGAGLKIGFKGDDLFFDFSDEVIAELICAYVGPKLATIIKQES